MVRNASPASAATATALAKTTRPALGGVVARERLFAALDGTPARSVMWISGPPGAGKTTLAASYVEARSISSLWYQVDADDDDAATLFHYLGHAARKLDGVKLANLPVFTPENAEDVAGFARRFFRQLLSGAKPPFALVLDNLHALPAEAALARVLDAAFSQVPKGSCIMVTSRSEPPASLARLRVTGEMVVVDAAQLRLDAGELRKLAINRGHTLDEATEAQLADRTRGWVAGLVLMLEHAKLAGQLADLPAESVPEVVFDYLAGEIFDRFDAKTQRFLLALACLPRMTADIARTLAGEEKAQRLLLNLALNNYFVTETRSAEGQSYRFHPLMRDFLRSRAARDAPAMLAAPHLREAARLLHRAGYAEDAVALCVEGRDWDQLAEVAAAEAGELLSQGRHEMLSMWLESLPVAVLRSHPDLMVAFAACRAGASPRAARRLFEEAFAAFREQDDRAAMARCCHGVIDAIVDEFDDLAQLDRWSGELAALLREGDNATTAAADAALARALLLRGAPAGELPACFARGNAPLERAVAHALDGEAAAADLAALARPTREPQGPATPSRAALAAHAGVALVDLLSGDHAAAYAAASECLATAARESLHGREAWLRAIAAAAALGMGSHDAARDELTRLEAAGADLRRGDRAILHYLRAWLADADGDTPVAQREARSAVALAAEAGLGWCECLARLGLARLLAAAADRRGAELHLRVAESLAERPANALLGFAARIARAEVAAANDDANTAEALAEAFRFGRAHGMRDTPWWRPPAAANLCVLALAGNIEPAYARELVKARALAPAVPPLRVPGWPWAFRITTLGDFRLYKDERAIEFSGKGPGRPAELLKVLLAQGGQNVRADQLADALWPNAEADYAHKSFTAALHRLRRLLGDDATLVLRDSRLSLNPALVWVDTWALEQILSDIEQAARAAPPQHPPAALAGLVDAALATYAGPFLEDESEQPAYIASREQVRARLLRCLARVARLWEEAGLHVQAADCLQRLIDADPLFEAPYRHLMLYCKRRGDLMEARSTYERLRATLAMRLKVLPSADTQAVYAELAEPARS